ncbi:protein of unknown function DUF1566 [Arcobacter nitrofigilis DSM 7299]|uniref:Lcl C-terminal domain-containing protein n=1 Tax=Arcobacter nitrofigilis (strain ATCC 33309 / DSM 7299 / CCUG 15893 / LMG 7604 / NCTC 12251 / CI) TaxID=572480 RepID=D5V516_ARCNC|nr:DUF1566 domain-containing protein [Arcobacter nitrofigilis]ADG91978.1 protein of unknown function DUF1566 [Arcobacter nitrofigilis DSM 7299]
MKYLLLIISLIAVLNAASLQRDNDRNIVIDDANKLVWMDSELNITTYLNHSAAQEYCEKLSYAGFDDWRLPEIEEFALIVDKKNFPKNINRVFRYSLNEGYWANTAHWRTLWFYADYMYFVSGTPYYDNRDKKKLVRCVRTR